MIFSETSPQSNSELMKIWVKFNAGFQLCPPDLNFAPPPPPDLAKLATHLGGGECLLKNGTIDGYTLTKHVIPGPELHCAGPLALRGFLPHLPAKCR